MSLFNSGHGWLVLVVGGLLLVATPVVAYDRSELEQRLAERRAQIEARRVEREAERTAGENELAVSPIEETCRCTTRLSFSKPSLQWRSGELVFVPKVDVSIRSRGEERIAWTAQLAYTGTTGYESADVAYSFSGWQLPAVSLSGLTRRLVNGEEIDGRVQMQAKLSGCGEDEEKRAFDFTLMDFGNLKVRGWRSTR